MALRMSAMMLAAAAANAWPRACWAQATTRPEVPATVIGTTIEQLSATLNGPQASAEARQEAARRLVARRTPEARQVLGNALQNFNNLTGQIAAARALANDPAPDPVLINPLFACIGDNRALAEAAANALAGHKSNPAVLQRLIERAQNRDPGREPVRIALIRVIGRFIEKPAAEFLINTLQNPREPLSVHKAAADALQELTGITDFRLNKTKWQNWWAGLARKTDADFFNDVLPRRSALHDQFTQRNADLIGGLAAFLDQQYRSADPSQRQALLLQFLNSPYPEFRAVCARLLRVEGAIDPTSIFAPVREQLKNMIGDSSAVVRTAVAEALTPLNDRAALDPLLEQLAQETDPNVRAAIARALGPINDLKAVEALLTMLTDPIPTVAQAAAVAIEQLGNKIRTDNPTLARRAAEELRLALASHPAAAGNTELRQALLDAMVPLRQETLLPFLVEFLKEGRESPEIRRLALKVIGEIGNPQSVGVIVPIIQNDKEAPVRVEAVRALGNLPNAPEYAEFLLGRLDPAVEPDASIRDRVWRILESLFPALTDQRLIKIVDRFANEPARRLSVLKALAEVQLKNKNLDDLAITRQNIGAALMEPVVNDSREAAEYFKQALEYQRAKPTPTPAVIERLTDDRMRALLRSGQYPEGIAFAGQSIAQNVNYQWNMGVAITNEVSRLMTAGELDNALRLIAEAAKIQPPLADRFRDNLSELESEIKKKQAERSTPTTRGSNVRIPAATNTASGS